MASKRKVETSLAEKPHGYEFLGPYVHSPLAHYNPHSPLAHPTFTHLLRIPPLTILQPRRLCHLLWPARPGLCLHVPVQRHLGVPGAHPALSLKL